MEEEAFSRVALFDARFAENHFQKDFFELFWNVTLLVVRESD